MINEPHKKKSLLRTLLSIIIPLIVTVGLCYILFTKVDFHETLRMIEEYCNFWWIVPALLLSILSHVIRALRWKIQLNALGVYPSLWHLVLSIFGTYSVNLVFPRLGEVWRTGYISNIEKASFTTVFGSMLSDRLSDFICVFLITLVTFLLASSHLLNFLNDDPERVEGIKNMLSSPWLWTALGVIIFGLWLVLKRLPQNRVIKKIREMWKSFWHGFAVIFTMKGRGRWLMWTGLLWTCYFLQLYVTFYAFDFTREILHTYGIIVPLICFVLSSISMALPSNGGYGPWQIAVMFGLGIFSAGIAVPAGTDFATMSAAFATCVMTSQTILLILLGIFTFTVIAISKHGKNKKLASVK